MKKGFVRAFLTVMFTTMLFSVDVNAQSVAINATNFPDATFRQYVSEEFDDPDDDGDKDGVLSDFEISHIETINIQDMGITNLKGVEFFYALERLYCIENQLTMLDLSNNKKLVELNCSDNQITQLNINGCTGIEDLACSGNKLTMLDVSGCELLRGLECDGCNLVSLNVNTNVRSLNCSSNQLTKLDVSKCAVLNYLDCSDNQLTLLDVSNHSNLEGLTCRNNKLTTLNLNGCTNLDNMFCENNQLTSLDVSTNPCLRFLYCNGNRITILDFSKNKILSRNVGMVWKDGSSSDDEYPFVVYDDGVKVIKYVEAPSPQEPTVAAYIEVPNWTIYRGNVVAIDKNGQVIRHTGVVKWRGYYLLLANGVLYKKATFFQDKVDGKWKYFQNGILARTGNTFIYAYGKLLHVNNGLLDTSDCFVKYNGKFIYSYHGMAAISYTGWVKYDKYKCYLVKGALTKIAR